MRRKNATLFSSLSNSTFLSLYACLYLEAGKVSKDGEKEKKKRKERKAKKKKGVKKRVKSVSLIKKKIPLPTHTHATQHQQEGNCEKLLGTQKKRCFSTQSQYLTKKKEFCPHTKETKTEEKAKGKRKRREKFFSTFSQKEKEKNVNTRIH